PTCNSELGVLRVITPGYPVMVFKQHSAFSRYKHGTKGFITRLQRRGGELNTPAKELTILVCQHGVPPLCGATTNTLAPTPQIAVCAAHSYTFRLPILVFAYINRHGDNTCLCRHYVLCTRGFARAKPPPQRLCSRASTRTTQQKTSCRPIKHGTVSLHLSRRKPSIRCFKRSWTFAP